MAQPGTQHFSARRSGVHPFAGPIKDQSGKIIVKAGEVVDDKTMLGMNFYVDGVEGKIPQ